MTFVNSVRPEDYVSIASGVEAVKQTVQLLHRNGVRCEVPHEHRYWEYGSAVQLMIDHFGAGYLKGKRVLDVGSGWGAVGPTLANCFEVDVTECEPDLGCRTARVLCNRFLDLNKKPQIQCLGNDILHLPAEKFDAVFCVSVMEHVDPAQELDGWISLVERVRVGGLFFATVDVVPRPGRGFVFDNLRTQNFTTDVIEQRVKYLEAEGMVTLGKPDYKYHGSFVHDYSFFRIGMMRER